MRAKIFDFSYYVQCLRRIRIVGIAMAILSVAITALIPIYHMISTSSADFYEVNASSLIDRTLQGNQLAVPALVFSYLMPVFVFLMFSYLNKRNESDFYHSMPLSRICVYTGSVAAALSWAWGILALSYLTAGALWTLDAQAVFSWGDLFVQLLYACMNATLLSGIATVAVCLMGTVATSVLASGALMFSWRFILYMFLLAIEDRVAIVAGGQVLGGYLTPAFLLPWGLIVTECNLPASVLVYSALVSVLAFLLGGVLYARRRSETAGRAVPGRWVQHIIRTLLCLPTALLLTYQLMGGTDGGTALVLVVLTVLIFYLYELLTTKRVRSMLRATPYLLALPLVCGLFFGAVVATESVVWHENITPERIATVGFYGAPTTDFGAYDEAVVGGTMIEDDEAVALVALALERAQAADREGAFYEMAEAAGPSYSSVYVPAYFYRTWVRVRLQSGLTVVRQVLFTEPEYHSLIACIRKEVGISPLPPRDEVKRIGFYLFDQCVYCELSGDDIGCFLSAATEEWNALDVIGQKAFTSRSVKKKDAIELWMDVKREGSRYTEGYWYWLDKELMPRAYAVLMESVVREQSSPEELREACEQAGAADADGEMNLWLLGSDGVECKFGYTRLEDAVRVLDRLLSHADAMAVEGACEDVTVIQLALDCVMIKGEDATVFKGYTGSVTLALCLTPDEEDALIGLCTQAEKGE